MILLGHPLVENEKIYKVMEKIDFTCRNKEDLFVFEWNVTLIKHCKENNLRFIVYIDSEEKAVVANALRAEAVIVSLEMAKKVQELAEYYLFDTKVALLIENEEGLEEAIKNRVDMVIFKEAIT